ncbi:polysaccharide biosynthesis tyrosine autokinase [Agrococcus jenensis]|uniref:non-specific protein-tyrosine kinase n=1 Tax=Agrococcus jenensis TaxID=46353 RepID=A0A3N2AT99_9MICO|nr:polysaccharide biosynthesis tyrosine autokinase [Agrococcus jenensis]ROR66251.1 capsular exopolysaccharide synthesis family protein [Agrococcus jenensis]
MELSDYLRVVRKNVILLLALMLAGVGVGALIATVQQPSYSAQTQVFVSTQGGGSSAELVQGNSFTLSRVKTYASLATSQDVLERVIADLGLTLDSQTLAESVAASPVLDTTIIEINAVDEDPALAARIADAVAASLATTVAEIESPGEGGSPVQLTTVERATVPQTPVSPRPMLNVALGALLGLALGIAIALLREVLDTRIRDERGLKLVTELPVVGSMTFDPKAKQRPLVVHSDPLSPRSEAYRTLRTNLQFVEVDGRSRTFVVTSSTPSEGKSSTAANLALALADAGETVILIDADLRKPKVAEYMNIDGSVGLTDVLIGRAELVDAVQMWGESSLYVLPSGQIPPNPSELLGSKSMQALITQLETEFDWVLFDAPPLLPVTDAAVLSRNTAGAIMVVASGRATRHQLDVALGMLENVDAPVAGVVLTMLPAKAANAYGAYGAYGEGYALSKTKTKPKAKAKARG